ncbi:MAG TPA: tRNA (guanosine(46)-N7)-methyltransferase TrmB [Corynebacteriales bacterium]|nr:tRNA (guanosine(46)-N7)-methyltransferase TrmB [Mycobacteriales bacterium]
MVVNDSQTPRTSSRNPRWDDPAYRAQLAAEKRAQNKKRNESSRLYPRVTAFRARHGAISDAKQRIWNEYWPQLGKNASDTELTPADIHDWFGREATTVLEIGFGTGTSTSEMAQAEPHINVLALEVYKPGIAQLLARAVREDIPNIRFFRGDAVDVMESMLPAAFLDGVRIFFPDPWPKARHHKRRLLQPGTFELISSVLKPGGILHVATDHADYAEFIEETGDACDVLIRRPEGLDTPAPMSLQRPTTKFENKGLRAGHVIHEFVWQRPPAPDSNGIES